MKTWEKDLYKGIKEGTSLLEIVSENIDKQTEAFSCDLDEKPSLVKEEIIKIVINSLNNDLERLCKKKR